MLHLGGGLSPVCPALNLALTLLHCFCIQLHQLLPIVNCRDEKLPLCVCWFKRQEIWRFTKDYSENIFSAVETDLECSKTHGVATFRHWLTYIPHVVHCS